MRIPPHTRIIVVSDDTQATREYGISREMVFFLVFLILAGAIVMGLLLHSVVKEHGERQRIAALELELGRAQADVKTAQALRAELEAMRQLQEKLLFMLGIEQAVPADQDSLAPWLEHEPASTDQALRRTASLALSPPPERWPARGFVTREFDPGNTVQGVLPHTGIDIAGPEDTPVLAAAGGIVVRAGTDEFLGNFVEIQHGLGYLTVYGHCARLAVNRGDRVEGGQVVAYMGKSGQATATHLHFEVWFQGEAVDPRRLLQGDPPQG